MNFFKRKTLQVMHTVAQTFETPRDPQVVIAEIHNEFDTATDRILHEAQIGIPNDAEIIKGDRLNKVGFYSAKSASKAAEVIGNVKRSEHYAELVRDYQQRYPNNKFITHNEVERICKKYGLLLGETKYYISDVPDKNLSEIENFKVLPEDMFVFPCGWHNYDEKGYVKRCKRNEPGAAYGYIHRLRWSSLTKTEENVKEHREPSNMMICASIKDFDAKNMRIEDGYKLELNLPDPIVLQAMVSRTVEGHEYNAGYLIVSKWGLEASDESLVNEKMN